MDHKPGTIRAALVGMTVTLCLASTLFAGACAVRVPIDLPPMRLTDPATDAQSAAQPSQ